MKLLAIAACRVSTPEQRSNNSLNRQEESVLKAATELGAEIPDDGWWSGDVSSKEGTNVNRKDLKQMLEYCRLHRSVKYLIVDEPDRFMRSIDEAAFFEVLFRQLGVKVWYASDPSLNTSDLGAKLLKFTKYLAAEGSNLERQTKSISGHEKAIREGRYTFPPKAGYMKGHEPGVHIPHPTEFIPLQTALQDIASGFATPAEALKRLNSSDFTKRRAPLKIDKFLTYIKHPYYAGIVQMDRQVKARCEVGRHEKMITPEQHNAICAILNGRKTRQYKRQQYNPEFPLNNLLEHDCLEGAKFTGSFQGNGHGGKYPKYRCRNCGKQYKREEINDALTETLSRFEYTGTQLKEFIGALTAVWGKEQEYSLAEATALSKRLDTLRTSKSHLLREFAAASELLKSDLQDEIQAIKAEVAEIEGKLADKSDLQEDLIEFVEFALGYANELKEDWWLLDKSARAECQQLLFPAGIRFDSMKKVSTTQISPLYRLATTKKAPLLSRDALMVELRGIAPRSVRLLASALQA